MAREGQVVSGKSDCFARKQAHHTLYECPATVVRIWRCYALEHTDGINLNPRNIRGGSLDVEDATTFTIFQEENATLAVDQLPLPKKDFLARRTGPQQFGTILG